MQRSRSARLYSTKVTARVDDPHLVSVEKESLYGVADPILPARGSPASVVVPGSASASVTRGADGSIVVHQAGPYEYDRTLVTAAGVLDVTAPSGMVGDIALTDPRGLRMDYTFSLQRRSRQSLTLQTPWSNVSEVREQKKLDRRGGRMWLFLGGGTTALGSLFFVNAALDPNATPTGRQVEWSLGSIVLGTGIVLMALGAFNVFASESDSVIYTKSR